MSTKISIKPVIDWKSLFPGEWGTMEGFYRPAHQEEVDQWQNVKEKMFLKNVFTVEIIKIGINKYLWRKISRERK